MKAPEQVGLFHGGVPGLAPGDQLHPAKHLGLHFAFAAGSTYLPDRVYLTTEVDQARRFATNYLDAFGTAAAGDVYKVQANGPLEPDLDYPNFGHSAGVFLMTSSATVVDVVARAVEMDEDTKWRIDARHAYWEDSDEPVYDAEGRMRMSPPMRNAGVPPEWLAVLKPWYDGRLLNHKGWFVSKDVVPAMFDAIPQLDTRHSIRTRRRLWFGRREYACTECSQTFGLRKLDAAVHQLGDTEVAALKALHRTSVFPAFLLDGALRRSPSRWEWLTSER